MTKFVGFRAKTYYYLIGDGNEDKAKGTKMCILKRKLKFENYRNCLEATQVENQIKYLEEIKFDIDNIEEFIKKQINIKNAVKIWQWKAQCFYWRN